MFSSKDLKVKMVYMGFGGMIAIIGMLFAFGMHSSVAAKKFDTIQCSRLEVVDMLGKPVVVLSGDSQEAFNYDLKELPNDSPKPGVFIGKHGRGGIVEVFRFEDLAGKSGTLAVKLNSAGGYGGYVGAIGRDGKSWARLAIDEYGGCVRVTSKGEGEAVMGINAYGHGAVSTWDKNGHRK